MLAAAISSTVASNLSVYVFLVASSTAVVAERDSNLARHSRLLSVLAFSAGRYAWW